LVTFFLIPQGFEGPQKDIQLNTLKSLSSLASVSQIILMSNDNGVAEAAKSFGMDHYTDIKVNNDGLPYISDAFSSVKNLAHNELLCYINSDILLDNSFDEFIFSAREYIRKDFLFSARRFDIPHHLENSKLDGIDLNSYAKSSYLHGYAGMDLYLFHRDFPVDMPEMLVGKPGWDSWLVFHTLKELQCNFCDITSCIRVFHQHHQRRYKKTDSGSKKNFKSAGGIINMGTLLDANYKMAYDRINDRIILSNNYFGILLFSFPIRLIRYLKRLLLN